MNGGSVIKRIRESKGIKSSFVAKNLELSSAGYWKLENDKTPITLERIEKIAPLLGMKPKELLEEFKKVF